jgi:hypothetical protein
MKFVAHSASKVFIHVASSANDVQDTRFAYSNELFSILQKLSAVNGVRKSFITV